MEEEKKYKTQTGSKYSSIESKDKISNSKALGVIALIALLLLFQIITFVVGKLNKEEKPQPAAEEKMELFFFNPNHISSDSLQLLGFSKKQAQTILNYRAKGGVFKVKRDFAKMYVVDSAKYKLLQSYILLPDDLPKKKRKKSISKSDVKPFGDTVKKEKTKRLPKQVKDTTFNVPKTDLNRADSSQLVKLYGIGPYFAKKILEYRERLGGSYANIEQLMEINNFTRRRFEAIEKRITVNAEDIIKFSLWDVDKRFIEEHPYIGKYVARGVLLFLEKNRDLKELSGRELLDIMVRERVIPDNVAKRLEIYVK